MDKETYKALKRIIDFTRGKRKELKNNDIKKVEGWIDEVKKEYIDPSEIICEGCGKNILEGESVINGENRHSVCS